MKRRLFTIFSICFLLLFVLVIVLLSNPEKRNTLFRIVTEVPSSGFYLVVRKNVISGDFSGINLWLSRQLSLAKMFSQYRTTFVPGLLKNAEYAINTAHFKEDYLALVPFLSAFVASYPELYRPHIWYAKALSYSNKEEALVQLEKAIRLLPGQNSSYQVAIGMYARLNDLENVNKWCSRYLKEKWGGVHFYDYNTLFYGNNFRQLALEVNGDKEGETQIIANRGMILNQKRTYEFTLNNSIKVENLRLHLGIPEGVKIEFFNIFYYLHGVQKRISSEEFYAFSSTGIFEESGVYISTLKTGSSISFIFRDKNVLLSMIDRFDFELSITKANLAQGWLCRSVEG